MIALPQHHGARPMFGDKVAVQETLWYVSASSCASLASSLRFATYEQARAKAAAEFESG